jgi:DNA polymerase-3 subunit epsilon
MKGLLDRIFGNGQELEGLPASVAENAALRRRYDASVDIMEADYVAFDTELTGLDFTSDSIISIGGVKMKGGRIFPARTFHSYLKPDCRLKPESVIVHEITQTELEGASSQCSAIESFLEFIGDAVLVGHFVHIDTTFLSKAMKKLYGVKLQNRSVDTMALHDWLYDNDNEFARHHKGMSLKKDLFSMSSKYGIAAGKAHDALSDAFLSAQLFQRFLGFLPGCGIRTLGDLVDVGKM